MATGLLTPGVASPLQKPYLTRSNKDSLVYLGRDTRTSTQSRRLVRRKDASWSLNWPSGANLLAHKQHKYFLCVPLWLLYLFFFVIGRVLTRLDRGISVGESLSVASLVPSLTRWTQRLLLWTLPDTCLYCYVWRTAVRSELQINKCLTWFECCFILDFNSRLCLRFMLYIFWSCRWTCCVLLTCVCLTYLALYTYSV